MKDKRISDLSVIDNAINDAKYVLDDATPCQRIRKVFIYWTTYLLVVNLLFYAYFKVSTHTGFFENELFSVYSRIFCILSNIISVVIYIRATKKVNVTLKEKKFLKTFAVFPVLLALIKMLPAVFYYINKEIMMQLYDTFSFDLVITFIALFFIMKYFKDKRYKYLLIGLFIYMCITFFLMYYVVNVYVVQSIDMFIFKIEDIIGIINEFSFYQIVVFGLSIYFMKDTDSKQ